MALNGSEQSGNTVNPATTAALAGKSDVGHTHVIGNVTGLQSALNAKADTASLGSAAYQASGAFAAAVHTHAIADVTGLQTALNAKADASALTTTNGTVAALQTTVAGKADASALTTTNGNVASNTANIATNTSSISALTTTVSGKANTAHTHVAADITNFNAAVDARIPAQAVTSVNGKTGAVALAEADIPNLVTDLAAKQAGPLTGDVTTSGAAATIAANAVTTAKINAAAVTYAKIQNVSAQYNLLGRQSSGAGVVEEIPVSAVGLAVAAAASNAAIRSLLNVQYYSGTTLRAGLKVFTTSVVISGGNAVFQLTDTLLSGGTARFANVDITSAQLSVFSTTALYFFSLPVLSNGGKTLTVGVTQLSSVLGILTLATAANGLTCNLTISGD